LVVAGACQPEQEETKVSLRRLPALARQALGLVMAAGRREFLWSSGLQLVGGVGLALQLLVGQRALQALLDADRNGGSLRAVMPWAGAVALLSVVGFFASTVQREQQQILGELVSRHVLGQILDVATAVRLESFETPDFHNRLQRVRSNLHQPLNMVYGLSGLVSAAVGVVGVVAALSAIEPLLIPLITVVLLPAWLVASRRGEAFYRFFWKMTPRDRERNYLASLLGDRDAAKEVRAFSLATYLRRRHDALYQERLDELRRVARRQLVYSLTANLGIGLCLGGMLLLIAWLSLTGRVGLSEAGIAVAGVAVVGARLTGAGWAAGALSEAALYMDDHRTFLDELPRVQAALPTAPAPRRFERLETQGLTFTYPSGDQPAVTDVSIQIEAGEVVALVGENGSGKTTLAKLLAGLYSPEQGTVTWDGTDVSKVDPVELSASVALIFQDFLRYHLTARENIGFGRHQALEDLGAIRNAAGHAGVDSFLLSLTAGYDTRLGPEFDGGTDLSIGQWQRMALARAFFRDAPFVILDEPTAALDPKAERGLFEHIRQLLDGRTVLLISHRFSSVRTADRIYVLERGRVIEHGTHQELIDLGGSYAELFRLQAAAYLR
jgi:ATP-binding cassette subfamily B protein